MSLPSLTEPRRWHWWKPAKADCNFYYLVIYANRNLTYTTKPGSRVNLVILPALHVLQSQFGGKYGKAPASINLGRIYQISKRPHSLRLPTLALNIFRIFSRAGNFECWQPQLSDVTNGVWHFAIILHSDIPKN